METQGQRDTHIHTPMTNTHCRAKVNLAGHCNDKLHICILGKPVAKVFVSFGVSVSVH